MLVNNEFIYVNLPRCASTSFYITCLKLNLSINHLNGKLDNQHLNFTDLDSINNEVLCDRLEHPHERLNLLFNKFGDTYDVISIDRDRHDRFISLWKHIIDELNRINDIDSYQKFMKLKVEDVLFFKHMDMSLMSEIINDFCNINNIKLNSYGKNMMSILYTPYSIYHLHYPKIKWFDFKKLNVMEEWVSDKLKVNFKMEKINSSQHFDCSITLDDNFIEKYNSIYDFYDIVKRAKTLI